MSDDGLRFPIGAFEKPGELARDDRARSVAAIAAAPGQLREAVDGLDDVRLDTPYIDIQGSFWRYEECAAAGGVPQGTAGAGSRSSGLSAALGATAALLLAAAVGILAYGRLH